MEFKKTACSHFYVKFTDGKNKWVRITKKEYRELVEKNKIDLLSNHLDTLSAKKLNRVMKGCKNLNKNAIKFIKKLACKFKVSRRTVVTCISVSNIFDTTGGLNG